MINDITPERSEVIGKFQRAYSAILDGKTETRLHRMKFDGMETSAIVLTKSVGKEERITPIFTAVTPEILPHMTTMWNEPMHKTGKPAAAPLVEPRLVVPHDLDNGDGI